MDREAFLDRIAARLKRPRQHRTPARSVIGVPEFQGRTAGADGDTRARLLERFYHELTAVGGGVRIVRSTAEASAALRDEIEHFRARRVITAARTEFSRFDFAWLWQELGARAILDPGTRSETEQRAALISAEIGLTTVDCAIAATGSLVLSAATTRPRALSLLPTVHVAVLFASQIRAQLGAAFVLLARPPGLPSAAHVITGPSRTSDIENDLTIGVHGPSAVTAIVVEEDPA